MEQPVEQLQVVWKENKKALYKYSNNENKPYQF